MSDRRNKRTIIIATLVAISVVLCGIAVAGETNITVKPVLVKMVCGCGGFMESQGRCLTSYPSQYPHVCNKCGTNAVYRVSYPEYRFVAE
jgi:hypothetical protein